MRLKNSSGEHSEKNMSSRSSLSTDSSALPDKKLVEEVAKACGCREETAITLLQRCQNDVERAIRQHSLLNRYLGDGRLIRSPSRTPIRPEAAHSADSPSPLPSPGSFTDEDDSEEDASSDQTPGLQGAVQSLSMEAPVNKELESGSSSHAANMASTGNELSNLQVVDTTPDETEEKLMTYGRSDLSGVEVPAQNLSARQWDFILPRIPWTINLNAALEETNDTFNIQELVGAVQNGANLQMIRNYLERYDRETVRRSINDEVDGFPAMFYVVESNNVTLLRLWVDHGGNPEVTHAPSKVPLLAFAITNGERIQTDTTLITSSLLSLGASPHTIPSAFYVPYLRDPSEDDHEESKEKDELNRSARRDPNTEWCSGDARTKFAKTVTLSQRYFLEKASKIKKPSQRHVQLAQRRNAEALLGLPYFLVGQTLASNLLLQKLLSHLISPSKRPLVLVFAGPSGHGKTELARKLGHLLSLELEVVDCTTFNREIELFGPREPYVGSEKGSPLNNFLARNAGKQCIVFLDEFEKTTPEIHKTLLLPFDNGEYQDRRDRSTVNCSNTIWILATNAHDSIIQAFCSANHEVLFGDDNESEKLHLAKTLSAEIRHDFLSRFGSPITGRISAFIPFLPFSLGEQAVVVHKYLLELGSTVEGPVDLSHGPREKLLGNVRVRIRRDATVCRILAQAEYHSDLGARSLINAVESIKNLLVEAYLAIDEQIVETIHKSTFLVDVQGGEIVVKMIGQK